MQYESRDTEQVIPMSEYARRIEAQKEQIRDAHVLTNMIGQLIELKQAAEKKRGQIKDAVSKLNRYMSERKASNRNFRFQVSNLPTENEVISIRQDKVVNKNVSEFEATTIETDGKRGIELIDEANLTVVRVEINSGLKIIPVFESVPDASEEE